MKDKFVINIGRQLGSGGKAVGEAVAARLGIGVYDKQLINLAAEQSGICPEIFEKADEKELRTLRGLRDAALFLIEYGAQNVIISMGKYGAMLVSRKDTFFAPALMVEARSTVGAGDAMIGGVLAGLSRGESLEDSFRCGVAAGAASVMTDGTQLLRRPDFEALLPKVTVQEV